MRRPHVYERSAPRAAREPFRRPDERAEAAKAIAVEIGSLVQKAREAGLVDILECLEDALWEAEQLAAEQ